MDFSRFAYIVDCMWFFKIICCNIDFFNCGRWKSWLSWPKIGGNLSYWSPILIQFNCRYFSWYHISMPKADWLVLFCYGWSWYSTSIPNPSKWIAEPCCKQTHVPSIVMTWMAKNHVGNAMGCIQCHFGSHRVYQFNAKTGWQPTDMTT